jgi:hypothetical protein
LLCLPIGTGARATRPAQSRYAERVRRRADEAQAAKTAASQIRLLTAHAE